MLKTLLALSATLTSLVGTVLWAAQEFSVAQKDKQFTVQALSVKVGDVVSFPNEDNLFHNIYSLSSPKIFDLGSYKKGETRRVAFDKPGIVEVRCAIHPGMKLKIVVSP